MNTVKLNSKCVDVLFLQERLGLTPNGIFDKKTDDAVREYQRSKGLTVDGIVGKNTWASFNVPKVSEKDFEEAAKLLNCDVASVKAIKEVESGGKGFIDGIRPQILFEGHVFYKNLPNPLQYTSKYPNIVYKSWNKSKYKGGNLEYDRLDQAWSINPTAALKSASVGLFQIMGGNYKLCGCKSVEEMWAKASLSEKEQLLQFCHFLKNSGIDVYLRKHDWVTVARKYNGTKYYLNKYDVKLKEAYDKYNKKS